MKRYKKIEGDASLRKFFRKKNSDFTSIIVFARKEKFQNLLVYDAINKVLIKNKILAPSLYDESYSKNFIEIEDFGKETIFKRLNKKKTNKLIYFKKIIELLIQIQSIKTKKIKNFQNKFYTIPQYNKKILAREAYLFCDWYAKFKITNSKKDDFSNKYKKIVNQLISELKLKEKVFVHRDFHVSNLMLVNDRIGIIDSQDALIGNKAYDLASLIDDVRLKTSKSFKKKVYNFYIKKQKKLELHKFKNDFEILSILRNLKIIGIFTRLAIRDGKKRYLKLIPYTWKLISTRINENKVFFDLKSLLKKNFKKQLNEN